MQDQCASTKAVRDHAPGQRRGRSVLRVLLRVAPVLALLQTPTCVLQDSVVTQYQILSLVRELTVTALGYLLF